jgi:hypothetical protein
MFPQKKVKVANADTYIYKEFLDLDIGETMILLLRLRQSADPRNYTAPY